MKYVNFFIGLIGVFILAVTFLIDTSIWNTLFITINIILYLYFSIWILFKLYKNRIFNVAVFGIMLTFLIPLGFLDYELLLFLNRYLITLPYYGKIILSSAMIVLFIIMAIISFKLEEKKTK